MASSLAIVLLRIKVRDEKKKASTTAEGMKHKTFYDLSSGDLWCHVCNIFCLRCRIFYFFWCVLLLYIQIMSSKHIEESQSVAFIPAVRDDVRKKCHAWHMTLIKFSFRLSRPPVSRVFVEMHQWTKTVQHEAGGQFVWSENFNHDKKHRAATNTHAWLWKFIQTM